MSSICRYCNKVELTFDNAFKSASGKMIPLDKTSGLPHSCSQNPYSKQQQQYQQQQQPQPQQLKQPEQVDLLLQSKLILQKLDKVLSLLEAHTQTKEAN